MFFRPLSLIAALLTATTHPSPPAPARHPAVTRPHQAAATAPRRPVAPVDGGDVSWPNCSHTQGIPGRHGYDLPMPTRTARFVVVGATNGPGFTRNPCLSSQATWVKQRHLWLAGYAVIHFPSSAELRRYGGRGATSTRVGHVGAAQARQAYATLARAGARPTMVWIDVETVGGRPWSTRATLNRSLITGAVRELRLHHVAVGVYSYRSAWNRITRGWRSSLPTWVPTGSPHRADALARCRQRSFSGGRVLLTQWTTGGRDLDLTCPGVASDLGRLFRRT